MIVELKKRYDERQTKQYQDQCKYILDLKVLEFERAEEEKEMNEKWQTTFSDINSLMKLNIYSDMCPLERENIRLKKRLTVYEDQNSKQTHQIVSLQESLKISEDQNSKQSHQIAGLQESLKIFEDHKNQDLPDSRLCKICMDQEVS